MKRKNKRKNVKTITLSPKDVEETARGEEKEYRSQKSHCYYEVMI